jgi:hypothetical protein
MGYRGKATGRGGAEAEEIFALECKNHQKFALSFGKQRVALSKSNILVQYNALLT